MFVDRLNFQQQCVLLGLAESLVEADMKVHPSELSFLEVLRQQMAAGIEPVLRPATPMAALFAERPAKVALMLELLGIALADGEFHPAEREICERVAKDIQLVEPSIAELESWCRRQLGLSAEAELLLAGDQ